ncbi:MAG TPA: ABC transporter substrate-binding protein [Hyphomicrobiales bacterium]|nr:ABC transporter substrate-binding protein [Hyphomicrobiales bacterium]
MKHWVRSAALAAAMTAALAAPALAKTIKIGLIAPFSGGSAIYGENWKQAIDVFMKEHGDTVGGDKIEIVTRDIPGPDPLKVRALAQELVVKEGVQYLAGIVYSPNALALGAFANQAKVPIVIFNAATSAILDKSPYFLRVSFTVPQISVPEAVYARDQGLKKMVTMVSDYAPGWDGEKFFSDAFEKMGGQVTAKIRIPLSTTDFLPYLNRAAATGAQSMFGFMPGGGPVYAFMTAYKNSGLQKQGLGYIGQADTEEENLPQYGDLALGMVTCFYYSASHRSPENEHFLALMAKSYPKVIVNTNHVDAYDGMRVIYHMIEATKGQKDADKAIASVMGMKWESPRGPVQIDPKTRDLIQNVYIRVVKKDKNGKLYNDEILAYPAQPDYGRAGHPLPTQDTLKAVKLD